MELHALARFGPTMPRKNKPLSESCPNRNFLKAV